MSEVPVRIVDVSGEVQPDNASPEAYAIYLILSHEPSTAWQRAFEEACRLRVATRRRPITVVGDRLRIVITRAERVQTVLDTVQEAVGLANERLGHKAR